jgi:preprotein translocase subunit SecY
MDRLSAIWKTKELRNSIIFVLVMLVIFRLAAHIPVPGVDASALRNFFSSNQIFGLMNIFSGGGLENFSIVMMGVGPYITSSIIFQLLGMIIPSLEEMNKEEAGRQKITMWTRWATVPLAGIQAYAMINLLRSSAAGVIRDLSPFDFVAMIITISAGTDFLFGNQFTDPH